jgi:hypothetical protein
LILELATPQRDPKRFLVPSPLKLIPPPRAILTACSASFSTFVDTLRDPVCDPIDSALLDVNHGDMKQQARPDDA